MKLICGKLDQALQINFQILLMIQVRLLNRQGYIVNIKVKLIQPVKIKLMRQEIWEIIVIVVLNKN